MVPSTLIKLPYHAHSELIFECLKHLDWPVWLDSGYPHIKHGRYDILSANPYKKFITKGTVTSIITELKTELSYQNPFELIQNYIPDATEHHGLPFINGALGYFGYDMAWHLESLPEHKAKDLNLPDMAIGLYNWSIVVDHHQEKTTLGFTGKQQPFQSEIIEELLKPVPTYSKPKLNCGQYGSNFSKSSYLKAFDRIQKHIRNGDCYQVNLAQRFKMPQPAEAWPLYRWTRQDNPGQYGGFFDLGKQQVLSFSPERFLTVHDRQVLTSPIKGTRRKQTNSALDHQVQNDLINSEKDKAENLMIVDLMRNDLSKTCQLGSVKVKQLFELQSTASVHHLVSHIEGYLNENTSHLDLFRHCFPGGSITGAPKIRSMEIIEALEPHKRSAYTGSLGYFASHGDMDTNINIRTVVIEDKKLYCWAGGGIVADSNSDAEYQETFDKVNRLLTLFSKSKTLQSADTRQ